MVQGDASVGGNLRKALVNLNASAISQPHNDGHVSAIRSVRFSPNGSLIISSSDDDTVRVWDAISGAHKYALKGHTDWIRSVVFSTDGSQIISGSDDCTMRVWDANSGLLQNVMEGFNPSHDTINSFLARSPLSKGPYIHLPF
jgi:WD40 repeat protein